MVAVECGGIVTSIGEAIETVAFRCIVGVDVVPETRRRQSCCKACVGMEDGDRYWSMDDGAHLIDVVMS